MKLLPVQQMTKDLVYAELRVPGDPFEIAAGVVRRVLDMSLQAPPDGSAREVFVEHAVKGALTALFLADKNLTRGSLVVVQAALDASTPWIEPEKAMAAALRGAADLLRFAAPTGLDEIGAEIDAKYMGAGRIFAEILRAHCHAA